MKLISCSPSLLPHPSWRGKVSELGGFCFQLCQGVSGAFWVTIARLCTQSFQPCFSSYHFSFWSQWVFIFLKLKYSGYVEFTSMEDATRRSLANCKNVCLCSKGRHIGAEPLRCAPLSDQLIKPLLLVSDCLMHWGWKVPVVPAHPASRVTPAMLRCGARTWAACGPLASPTLRLCCNPPRKPRLIFLGKEQIGAKLSAWFSALSTSIGQRPGVKKPVGQSSKLSCWSQGSACCLLMCWATGQGVNDSGFGFLMSIQASLALLGYSCLHFPEGVGAESRIGEFPCASWKTAGFLLWSQTHWKAC